MMHMSMERGYSQYRIAGSIFLANMDRQLQLAILNGSMCILESYNVHNKFISHHQYTIHLDLRQEQTLVNSFVFKVIMGPFEVS